MENETIKDYRTGDRVRYIPVQAKGDPKHPDCADGKVTLTKRDKVYVRFDKPLYVKLVKGTTAATPLAVSPENLLHLSLPEKEEEKKEEDTNDIKSRALALPEMVKAIIVTDDKSLDRANRAKVYCKTIRKGIIEDYKPLKVSAKETHKKLCDRERKALEPVEEAETYINGQIEPYMTKLRQIREEAERAERERKEAKEKEAEKNFQEALAAENAGEQEKAIEIIESPPDTPPTQPEYIPPKRTMEKVHMRKFYEIEIININLIPGPYVIKTANIREIQAAAKASEGKIEIPGVKIYRKDRVV